MVTQLDKEIVSDGGSEHRVSRILWCRAAANSRPVVEHDSETGCKAPGDLAPAVAAFAETRLKDDGGPAPENLHCQGGGFAIWSGCERGEGQRSCLYDPCGPSTQADKQSVPILMSTKWPAIAAAAAIEGETRGVRPLNACRPSKFRCEVKAQLSHAKANP
jgi:hypothetical protein